MNHQVRRCFILFYLFYFPSDCPQSDECFILFHLFIFHLIVPNQMNAPPLIDFSKSTCSSDCPQSDVTPELIFPNQLFI